MRRVPVLLAALALLLPAAAAGGTGMVMNPNTDTLPPGCESTNGWANFTVAGGSRFASQFPGTVYTFDNRSYHVDRCQKVTVTFVNHDHSRHQWMVHGLPRGIHRMGMFNIEVTGPGNATGTFIAPAVDETLLVHCGLPQHEQKGMKAQLVVGEGDGTLANVPGVSGSYDPYPYPRESPLVPGLIVAALGLVLGAAVVIAGWQYGERRTDADEPARDAED